RRHKHKPTGQLGIGELGYRPNVVPRYDEQVERVGGWAEDAALYRLAQRNFTRRSRSGGLSASPSSTRITNFFSQCGVGYAPSLRSMFWEDPSGILIVAGNANRSHHSSPYQASRPMSWPDWNAAAREMSGRWF